MHQLRDQSYQWSYLNLCDPDSADFLHSPAKAGQLELFLLLLNRRSRPTRQYDFSSLDQPNARAKEHNLNKLLTVALIQNQLTYFAALRVQSLAMVVQGLRDRQ